VQDNSLLTFIIALVGIIGTGIGILASLIPIELAGKRDYHQRLIKVWKLLDFERNALISQCENPADYLPEAPAPRPMIVASLPSSAWQSVRSNGELISDAPQELLNSLNIAYEMVARLNVTLDHYSIWASTPNADQLEIFHDRTRYYHRIINSQRTTLAIQFRDFERQIAQQIKMHEKIIHSTQKWINSLKWIAGVVYGCTVIASLVLVVLLIFHH
jgi:hypothetical protein